MGGIYTFPSSREGRVNRAFEGRAGEKKVGLWRRWGRSAAVIGSFQARSRVCWVRWSGGLRNGAPVWSMSTPSCPPGSPERIAEVEGVDVYSCPVYYQFEARGLCLFVHVRLECLRCELRPQPQTLSFYNISGSIPRGE
jgi:hypothetical protein